MTGGFEGLFEINQGHTLEELSFSQHGSLGQRERWKHIERDASGQALFTYESWHDTSLRLPIVTHSGYRKYDINGNLVFEAEGLPF